MSQLLVENEFWCNDGQTYAGETSPYSAATGKADTETLSVLRIQRLRSSCLVARKYALVKRVSSLPRNVARTQQQLWNGDCQQRPERSAVKLHADDQDRPAALTR
jgi:hypothetical protein